MRSNYLHIVFSLSVLAIVLLLPACSLTSGLDKFKDYAFGGHADAGDGETNEMWLRQVQTTPSDFLKAKFSSRRQQGNECSAFSVQCSGREGESVPSTLPTSTLDVQCWMFDVRRDSGTRRRSDRPPRSIFPAGIRTKKLGRSRGPSLGRKRP